MHSELAKRFREVFEEWPTWLQVTILMVMILGDLATITTLCVVNKGHETWLLVPLALIVFGFMKVIQDPTKPAFDQDSMFADFYGFMALINFASVIVMIIIYLWSIGYAWYNLPVVIITSGFIVMVKSKLWAKIVFAAGILAAIAVPIYGWQSTRTTQAHKKEVVASAPAGTTTPKPSPTVPVVVQPPTTVAQDKTPTPPPTTPTVEDPKKQEKTKNPPAADDPNNPSQFSIGGKPIGSPSPENDVANDTTYSIGLGVNLKLGQQKRRASASDLELPKDVPPARPNASGAPVEKPAPEAGSTGGHNITQDDLSLFVEFCNRSGSMINCEGYVMNDEDHSTVNGDNSFKFWDGTAHDNQGYATSIAQQQFAIDGVSLWGDAQLPAGFKNKFKFHFKDPGDGTSQRMALSLRIKWRGHYSTRNQTNVVIK